MNHQLTDEERKELEEQLRDLRTLESQAKDFQEHPLWKALCDYAGQQMKANQSMRSAMVARGLDELIKDEFARGGQATLQVLLHFPQMMLDGYKSEIDSIKTQLNPNYVPSNERTEDEEEDNG